MTLSQKVFSYPALLTIGGVTGLIYSLRNKNEETEIKEVKIQKSEAGRKTVTDLFNCIGAPPSKSTFEYSVDKQKVESCRKETKLSSPGFSNWFK